MLVIEDNAITVTGADGALAGRIREMLTFPNPEYTKKRQMGFWTGNTPKMIKQYVEGNGKLTVPYGFRDRLRRLLDGSGEEYQWLCGYARHGVTDYGGEVPLRGYQETAVGAMVERGHGILKSAPGSGKTQMGLAIAARHSTPCLWITHTRDLLQQSRHRAGQYFDKGGFGLITEGSVEVGRTVTFATVQTLANTDILGLRNEWDVVVCDECHNISKSATRWTRYDRVLSNISAAHKYGLSATVHRSDGLIQTTYNLLGDVAYTVPGKALEGLLTAVRVRPVMLGTRLGEGAFNADWTINWTGMVTDLAENRKRNAVILEMLKGNAGHVNIVLSDRLSQLAWLADRLDGAYFICGKTPARDRRDALDAVREGGGRYLLASYGLAKEGLDIPRADRLHLLTPHKDYAVVTQAVGRIARAYPGKNEAVCYDYVDREPVLLKSFRERCRVYRKGGFDIESDE